MSMDREDLERLVLEEHAASTDEEVAADARRRLEDLDADEETVREARERRGYGISG